MLSRLYQVHVLGKNLEQSHEKRSRIGQGKAKRITKNRIFFIASLYLTEGQVLAELAD